MTRKIVKNKILYLFIPLLFFYSCGIILTGSKPKGVYVKSNIKGAIVLNSEGRKVLGKTPVNINLKATKPLKLLLEKEDYAAATTEIGVKENAGIIFLDAMLLCIPCIPDFITGTVYQYNMDSVFIPMKRIARKDEEVIPISVGDIKWKLKEGETVGKEGKSEIFFNKTTYDSRIYSESICKELDETFFDAGECSENSKRDFSYVKNSQIFLTPIINKFNLLYVSEKSSYYVKMDITWEFTHSNNGSEVIYQFHDIESAVIGSSEKRKSLNSILLLSLYKLIDNEEAYKKVLAEYKNKNVTTSKKENSNTISIPKYKPDYKGKPLTSIIKNLVKSVVTIEHNDGIGSGFIISSDGYIITNYHVVEGKKSVNVKLNESLTLNADVIKTDKANDLALLKLQAIDMLPVALGNSDKVEIGEEVIAIGSPLELGQTVSKGIVSGKRKFEEHVYIQTDVSVNPGNSGGPLINQEGEVIGIVTLKVISKGFEGIAFCIPINEAIQMLNINYTDEKK